MNIQQLKCFVEVSKTLNFTKASQNLFISQTAVSNHIKHLEETLGFHLFIRNKKHVQLTQQGKIFLKSALKVLEANQECYQMIQYLHHENFGQLRIGYLKGIEHCIMIKNIQNFYQHNKHMDIQLYRDSRQEIEELLKNHKVDCVFTARVGHDPIPFEDQFDYRHIYSYPFVVAMSKNHVLSSYSSLNYFDIKNQTHVIMDTSHPDFISHDLDTLFMHLAISQDTAILAQFVEDYYAYQKYLCFLPLKDFSQQFHIYLIWHKNSQNKNLNAFLQSIKKRKNNASSSY